ncbi:hypothetical protein KYC5002_32775 [Archangium violaceum]|nr:hypothetical protein KYC5002_32775 [Archangium gephyra]
MGRTAHRALKVALGVVAAALVLMELKKNKGPMRRRGRASPR